MAEISLTVGDQDFDFVIEPSDYNRYLNEQMPQDKVNPAFNFLMRTVVDEQKESFKKSVMVDGAVNGFAVIQIAGVLASESGAMIEVSLKKPSKSQQK